MADRDYSRNKIAITRPVTRHRPAYSGSGDAITSAMVRSTISAFIREIRLPDGTTRITPMEITMTNRSNWFKLVSAACAVTGLAAFCLPAGAQTAQTFPNKPIRIIVPYAPGGTTDMLARSIGQKLTEYWGQPVIVENKPGGNGWIGQGMVAKAPADGYTFGVFISSIIYADSLYSKMPFDPKKDFAPVSMLARSANALVVPASFPGNNLADFIKYAKANPGKLNYGSFGQGTSAHIFGEALNLTAKLDLIQVPYKGVAPLMTDLLGGQLTSAIVDVSAARPQASTGRIKVLALSGTQRNPSFPQSPTFSELGYKGFEPVGFFLAMAPAGTAKDIVNKLSSGIARAMKTPELVTKLQDLGQEVVGSTPEELGEAIARDAAIFDKAIKQAHIKIEN
jgi:tripartite-type tricarboxylate transporter receptor subunit TctC